MEVCIGRFRLPDFHSPIFSVFQPFRLPFIHRHEIPNHL